MSRGLFLFLTFALAIVSYGRVIQVTETNKCDTCKTTIQQYEPEIIAHMEAGCEQLPVNEQDMCKDYVRILADSVTPDDVCETLKMCPPRPKKYWLGFLG